MSSSKFRAFAVCCLAVLGVACATAPSYAATYYVATNGVNANATTAGSKTSPFLTITFAATKTLPGDTVRVQPGLYAECPTIKGSGSNGSYINYVADGAVVCRGFVLSGVVYVNIIGFEITHNSSTFNDAIVLSGTCSHVGIYDNYIHNIHATHGAIITGNTPIPTYITIRGNTIEDTGFYNGAQQEISRVAIGAPGNTSDHWLVEYNTIRRCGDYLYLPSAYQIARNNSITDYDDRTAGLTNHVDGFQSGSDRIAQGTHDQLYERNWLGEIRNHDSHFGLWQDTVTNNDRNIVIRGNVAYHLGSGGIGVISTKNLKAYNNTMHDLGFALPGSGNGSYYTFYSISSNFPTNGAIINAILSDNGKRGAIDTTETTGFRLSNNLGYLVTDHSSYISTNDPLFVDVTNHEFRLRADSPARAVGTYLTTVTSPSGSGTTIDVSDALWLRDGYGISDGDTITVNGNPSTVITSITNNTITVTTSQTWTNQATIFWGAGTTPDLGGLPYGSTELTAATLSDTGTTYTVTPRGDCRGVWFYVDGIPTAWVSTPPYSATIASGTVTAKAYALYAQAVPVVPAGKRLTPPSNLRTK